MGLKLSTNTENTTNMSRNLGNRTSSSFGDMNQYDQSNAVIPSVFVDKDLLQFDDKIKHQEVGNVYEIDGKVYTDNIQDVRFKGEFKMFKLFAERIPDTKSETDTGSETDSDSPAKLEMDVKIFELGYLINSLVYLNDNYYHTQVLVADDIYCFVCDQIVCDDEIFSHNYSEGHEINLELYPPLEEFGTSIVRQKQDLYHCGVCNVVFHKNDSEHHFNEKSHDDNLSLATKVPKKYKNNDMIRNNKSKSSNIKNYTPIINKNTGNIFSTTKKVDKNDDIIRNENNDSKNENNDSKNENNDSKNENNDADDKNTINLKDKYIVNKDVTITLGNTQYNIPFYTWNMISISKSPKNNNFYCMACKSVDSIVNMDSHIIDISHENNLKTFKLIGNYPDHIFRQDEKFAHCSTCNLIVLIDGIDNHLSTKHRKRDVSLEKSPTPEQEPIKTNEGLQTNINKTMEAESIPNNPSTMNVHTLNVIMNERVVIFLFQFKISVLMISLNMIFRNETGFYCGICKCNFPVDCIYLHMKDPIHLTLLNSIPAIVQYGYNYIRIVQGVHHCGICHMIIPHPHLLINHLHSPAHISMANICLGITPQQLITAPQPIAVARVALNVANVNNEAQNVDDTNSLNNKTNIDDKTISLKNEAEAIKCDTNLLEDEAHNLGFDDENSKRANQNLDYEKENLNSGDKNSECDPTNLEYEAQNSKSEDTETQIFEIEMKISNKSKDSTLANKLNNDDRKVNECADDVLLNAIDEKLKETNDSNFKNNDSDIFAEDFVYNKNKYAIIENEVVIKKIKITLMSYNTMVPKGDGDRYCFVCDKSVKVENLEKHINNYNHVYLLKDVQFVTEYANNLIRQKTVLYHCALCNTILRRSDLKHHLDWLSHKKQYIVTPLEKKLAKINVKYKEEGVYFREREPEIKIVSLTDEGNVPESE